MAHATITALNVYPVKSCRGIAIDHAAIELTGFPADRHWMVVDEKGGFLCQRRAPRLATIIPELTTNGLTLGAADMPCLHVAAEAGGAKVDVGVILDRCSAIDVGPEPAEWLSEYLERPARLVRFDPHETRPINPQFYTGDIPSAAEFSDGFPFLIASESSLADLNSRLDEPVPMNRFRPNVVLEGLAPFDEDRIHELVDGPIRLQMARPCTRCKIVTTDQITGEVPGMEPLTTLRTFRWNKELPGIMFGHYAVVADGIGCRLRVGQRLEIQWK